jgi:hypothetical protein
VNPNFSAADGDDNHEALKNPAAALILVALALVGCKQDSVAEKYHPAKLDSTEVKGIMKVTLDSKAAERIGLETAEITEEDSKKVIPYSALMYDLKGNTWTFTNPPPLVFMRAEVKVADITATRSTWQVVRPREQKSSPSEPRCSWAPNTSTATRPDPGGFPPCFVGSSGLVSGTARSYSQQQSP